MLEKSPNVRCCLLKCAFFSLIKRIKIKEIGSIFSIFRQDEQKKITICKLSHETLQPRFVCLAVFLKVVTVSKK